MCIIQTQSLNRVMCEIYFVSNLLTLFVFSCLAFEANKMHLTVEICEKANAR